tara:strand:+ start:694 stop:981 length:288 start_codon:yes stop_codon:yes gene_type:complete
MDMHEQMNMVEILSEELGQKELKIMSLEKEILELEKLKDKEISLIKQERYEMKIYLESREVNYCEKCGFYGDDDEFVMIDDTCEYICESCEENLK